MLVKKATGKVEWEIQQAGFNIHMYKKRKAKVFDSHISILVSFPYPGGPISCFNESFPEERKTSLIFPCPLIKQSSR